MSERVGWVDYEPGLFRWVWLGLILVVIGVGWLLSSFTLDGL